MLPLPVSARACTVRRADIEMRPLPHADIPVSDVSADLHLLRKRPAKVATSTAAAADVTPRLLFEEDSSRRDAPLTFRSSASWFVADAAVARHAGGTAPAPGTPHAPPRAVPILAGRSLSSMQEAASPAVLEGGDARQGHPSAPPGLKCHLTSLSLLFAGRCRHPVYFLWRACR